MFIRHPSSAAIQVTVRGNAPPSDLHITDLSLGGLSYRSCDPLEPETLVSVRIELVRPAFEEDARTVWCKPRDQEFDIGLAFIDPANNYRIRMVEQICYIEHYRNEVRQQQGRILDTEQAAAEWISKYASGFPGLDR